MTQHILGDNAPRKSKFDPDLARKFAQYCEEHPEVFYDKQKSENPTPAQIPDSLNDLGDTIRAIERESGQASQLMVKVGEDKYLVGDLRKRRGEYRLEMLDEYAPDPFKREDKVKNPYKGLTGNYASFDALNQALGKLIIGNSNDGYTVAIPGISLGSLGQAYYPLGKIIVPLLQDGEKVSVEKISR